MMMGCVMYIATLKGEVWHKLKPKSIYTPAPFSYKYGFHFVLMICSFTSAELAGFCAVMLFINWYKVGIQVYCPILAISHEQLELI